MALEVQEGLAGDVADHLDLVRTEPHAAGLEPLEVVELAGGVDGRPGIPEGLVGRDRRVDVRLAAGSRQRPGEDDVGRPVRLAAEGDDPAGEVADPGLLLARQLADLVLDELDPASGDRVDVVIR